MIQQDNIRDFAVAAYRYYAYVHSNNNIKDKDYDVLTAVEHTIKHLKVDGEIETVKLIEDIYCTLPKGKIHKNVITDRVNAAANKYCMDPRTVWRKLARARKLFKSYYENRCD